MLKLEEMAAFFEARLDGYENQMTENVQGCREAYALIPTLLLTHGNLPHSTTGNRKTKRASFPHFMS